MCMHEFILTKKSVCGGGDSKVQWSGEPLAYENTLGSSLIPATGRLRGLEPQSLHLLTRI